MHMYAYADGMCEMRRKEPHDDLISVLLESEVDGDHLTQMQIDVFFMLLQNAGSETTRNLITTGLLVLLENPDQYDKLRGDPSLIPVAIEELLRYVTPVIQFTRHAVRDTEVGGQAIAEGDLVCMVYSAANRDERAFDQPDALDITRQPNDHVAFGAGGPHFCLGASLARLEARIMFEALLTRFDGLAPSTATPTTFPRVHSNLIDGYSHAPDPLGRPCDDDVAGWRLGPERRLVSTGRVRCSTDGSRSSPAAVAGSAPPRPLLFARHGAHVVIAEIDEDRGRVDGRRDRRYGRRGEPRRPPTCAIPRQVVALRDAVLADHGHGRRARQQRRSLGEARPRLRRQRRPSIWDALYQVNFQHVLTVTQAFLPAMIERGRGSIINVSSVEGLRGYPPDPVYGAFKAAVVQFTKCLAVQVGIHGVRVNGIGPDVTESLQVPYSQWIPEEQQHLWPLWVPVGRMGVPADQARVLLFLASDLSAFVTGHTIPTDGGTGAGGGWFRSESRPGRSWTNRPINP